MEDLTKQQIVLLTLLVSFVTSMATGVVTVSLMSQNQFSIVQTINKVVERTVERTVDPSQVAGVATATTSLKQSLASVVDEVSGATIRIKPKGIGIDGVTGIGIILSKTGLVLTDKSVFDLSSDGTSTQEYVALLSTGEEFPIKMIQSEIIGDIAFAALVVPTYRELPVVTWSMPLASMKLGESLYVVSGSASPILIDGVLKKTATTTDFIDTSISSEDILVGSPLFTAQGDVVGFKTASLMKNSTFYPVQKLGPIMPQISR